MSNGGAGGALGDGNYPLKIPNNFLPGKFRCLNFHVSPAPCLQHGRAGVSSSAGVGVASSHNLSTTTERLRDILSSLN